MQPYFLPYIGYFQLIQSVDRFVVYDNIKYTKKGWINRNRFLQNGRAADFTLPLKKGSDFLDVRDRFLSPDFNKSKLLQQIKEAYRKAPCFSETFALFENVLMNPQTNLFLYIYDSLREICRTLRVSTPILISSQADIDHSLKSQDKVIALCQHLGTDVYVNAIGGQELYSREAFDSKGIALRFIRSRPIVYPQFQNEFVPWLSILDVMMFNPVETILPMLRECDVIKGESCFNG
jgi:hypothetical protein